MRELPSLYADIEADLAAHYPFESDDVSLCGHPNEAFLQMGSWIGGDRDGNPNVNGDTMRHALGAHAATILSFIWMKYTSSGPNCRSRP